MHVVLIAAGLFGMGGASLPQRVDVAPHGGFSHVIYLNDCRPDGCVVVPGEDDARANRSSIPQQTSQIPPWPHGDAAWDALVACVRDTYAPFDIQIVTTDPGQASHSEVFIGGNPEDVQYKGALGLAPFIGCGGIQDNVPSFVFANLTSSTDILCHAVAQESAHVFGLDHEVIARDPMTYIGLPERKRFQNEDGNCGEEPALPRECACGGATQNSFQFLSETFGANPLPPPAVTIRSPHEGAWVTPGFVVGFSLESSVDVRAMVLDVDGATIASLAHEPFAFNAPADLTPGAHVVHLAATDQRNFTGDDEVTVQVLPACGAGCADGTLCLGGVCVPNASQPGGLGAACTESTQCGSGQCTATVDDGAACTAPCDPGRICPSGYSCVGAGGGLCWPGVESGGCNAGGGGGAGRNGGWTLALLSILLSAVIMRRQGRPHGHRSTLFDA